MLSKFSEVVEKGRVRTGQYGTEPGFTCGAFRLRYNGQLLNVIVGDGQDWQECDLPLPAWEHVSVSTLTRTPTWEEMTWVKSLFFAPEECVLQFHPPASSYVNTHNYCLHLWRPIGVDIPMPPVPAV